jgi:hypothetical protein
LNLESLLPGISPLVSFIIYFVVLDFVDYWYHRASHHFGWWWGLHSLHHSQQNMNLWSDNRNHLLDDFLRDVVMALVALGIGVPPGQYVLLVSVSRILQSLQHANVRIHFGRVGERLLISPVSTARIMPSAWGMSRKARAAWAVATSAWSCRFGICCWAPRISPRAMRARACATSWRASTAQAWAGRDATMAAASGSSNGWACAAWWNLQD